MAGASQEQAGPSSVMWKVGLGVLMLAVGVVIVLALTSGKPVGPEGDTVFICTDVACNNQWSWPLTDLKKLKYTPPKNAADQRRYECPKCLKMSSVQARKCDSCGEYFVFSQALKGPNGAQACPKCKASLEKKE
jgi:hypothetical protein